MATIQWFPGHMSKARRQVQENIKFVDFVTILVDARLPLSSQNPMLTKIVGEKPKLLILNKGDLADSDLTKEWRRYFESQGIKTLAINSKEQSTVKKVTEAAKSLMKEKIARQKERGIQIETLRTMIIGIPNAGKSTLMKLIMRWYDSNAGSVFLTGVDSREVNRQHLQASFAYVPQIAQLFHQSLRENLLLGRNDISDESIWRLAERCRLKECLER